MTLGNEMDGYKYADGHFSIEHQIDIHVRDMVESPEQLGSVLEGLSYLVDYRLANRKHPHLDFELMRRLALALLEVTGRREGAVFLRRRLPTAEADAALKLFRDLLKEVDEFGEAVSGMLLQDLQQKLQLHCRFYEKDCEVAMEVLLLLSRRLQCTDWRDFIKPDRVAEVESIISDGINSTTITNTSTTTKPLYPPQALYFDRSVERVLDMFSVDPAKGLTSDECQQRAAHYGTNKLPSVKEKSWIRMLVDQLNDFMIGLLAVAAVVSVIIEPNDLVSPVVLLLVIIVNVVIGFVQERRATKALSSLLQLQVPKARCKRDGHEFETLDADQLVPGDVVLLQEGDAVPADIRLTQCFRLEIVESVLTGESLPVCKQPNMIKKTLRRLAIQQCTNCAFMGTVVARGTGQGVVVRVGTKTEMGSVSEALHDADTTASTSRLQQELKLLGQQLVYTAVSLCVLVILIGWWRGNEFKSMLHYGLNLAVSVIPEGLVAVVTVAMAVAVGRMARQKAIVRKLPAVETLGAVNVICTDKTGTLTCGQMRVEAVEYGYDLDAVYTVLALCNNAVVDGDNRVSGADSTETALLQAALTNGFNKTKLLLDYKRMIEIPFDSDRKMMSMLLWHDDHGDGVLLAKGAPEVILTRCTTSVSQSGDNIVMDEEILTKLSNTQSKWSDYGWRVLALADRPIASTASDTDPEIESNLRFVGLVALVDPPRPGISGAIADCHRAGISVIMITGDHPATATAIARQIGIKTDSVLRGREVDILGEAGLTSLSTMPTVFARVSPQNKLTIVKALQARNMVTAMTGDGVNDAPAIKRADCGIAMGLTGTDLAKQAADIILADDSFDTIMKAVLEGRRVYDNVQKFVVYLLACNSAEIWCVLVALIFGLPPPLASIHILFANIIADIPPSMSLSMEPSEVDLAIRRPRGPDDLIMNKWNILMVIFYGLLIAVLSLSNYIYRLWYEKEYDLIALRSEAFVCLTCLQLLLAFMSRSLSHSIFMMNPTHNIYMMVAVLISLMALLLGCFVPGLNGVLELTPVTGMGWCRIGVCMAVLLSFGEVFKLIRRNKTF